jgi:hypothetical protein
MTRYEYKVLDTVKDIEEQLNALGAEGWRVVGVTTKKQLFIAPPQAIILMREVLAESGFDPRERELATSR